MAGRTWEYQGSPAELGQRRPEGTAKPRSRRNWGDQVHKLFWWRGRSRYRRRRPRSNEIQGRRRRLGRFRRTLRLARRRHSCQHQRSDNSRACPCGRRARSGLAELEQSFHAAQECSPGGGHRHAVAPTASAQSSINACTYTKRSPQTATARSSQQFSRSSRILLLTRSSGMIKQQRLHSGLNEIRPGTRNARCALARALAALHDLHGGESRE